MGSRTDSLSCSEEEKGRNSSSKTKLFLGGGTPVPTALYELAWLAKAMTMVERQLLAVEDTAGTTVPKRDLPAKLSMAEQLKEARQAGPAMEKETKRIGRPH